MIARRYGWKTWFELLLVEPKPYEPPCPGTGRCHGCLCWCAYCGRVSDMCDADLGEPGTPGCDTHKKYPPPRPKPDPSQLSLFGDI